MENGKQHVPSHALGGLPSRLIHLGFRLSLRGVRGFRDPPGRPPAAQPGAYFDVLLVFGRNLDPESRIQDPGSRSPDPGSWVLAPAFK